MRTISRSGALLLLSSLAWLAAGCGNGGGSGLRGRIEVDVDRPDACDPLDGRHCLLPFPSDTLTVADATTDTGLRVHFSRDGMPENANGVRVDPTEWNRNDGFSPGSQILTYVAGVDLGRSGVAPITDIGASLAADAPIVLLDADTGERIPYWAELDAQVESDADRMLIIRPAVSLREGHRHVVALRRLRDGAGQPIEAGAVFRAYRDRLDTGVEAIEGRRERYERVFAELERAGVARGDLYLAWDFTVISGRSLHERVLRMRDDAFARLGGEAPAFEVTEVEEDVDDRIARRVRGTFAVPLYLEGDGSAGSRIHYGGDGLPAWNGTYTADFLCIVPRAALAGPDGAAVPARAAVYGHGLLGSEGEVSAGNVRSMANEHDFVFCATKWIGMSEEDIGNAISILQDFSRFPTLPDRGQQGLVNTLFLGRLMIHPRGLSSHPAFQDAAGRSVIDTRELYYDGNSQGGIMGGAATAISVDWTRAVLGVTGMNYSLLLHRSVDWTTFDAVYRPSYPDELERTLLLTVAQMLWDRADADGYAQHVTDDPLPGTPRHRVLMHIAFGDHQVAPASAEIEARTIGARIHMPAVAPGRLPDVVPYWGIEPIPSYPYEGSAMVVWDSGSPAPPLANLPPTEGRDPHEDPRADPDARRQKAAFLAPDGVVIDVCGGAPCTAEPAG